MFALLKIPLVRHILAGIVILLIGFYTGNRIVQKRLTEARRETSIISAKYEQLNDQYERLAVRTDTLQKSILLLAKQERIKIDNHIKETKIKRGGRLVFDPSSRAVMVSGVVDTLVLNKPIRKDSWVRRIFKRKN